MELAYEQVKLDVSPLVDEIRYVPPAEQANAYARVGNNYRVVPSQEPPHAETDIVRQKRYEYWMPYVKSVYPGETDLILVRTHVSPKQTELTYNQFRELVPASIAHELDRFVLGSAVPQHHSGDQLSHLSITRPLEPAGIGQELMIMGIDHAGLTEPEMVRDQAREPTGTETARSGPIDLETSSSRQTAPAGSSQGHLYRPVVSLSNLSELRGDLDQLVRLRSDYQKRASILKRQIELKGGAINAEPAKIIELDEVLAKQGFTEQTITAIEYEMDLQVRLRQEVQRLMVFTDAWAMISDHAPSLIEIVKLMPPDVQRLYRRDSVLACVDPSYLSSQFDTINEIEDAIELLEEVRPKISGDDTDLLRYVNHLNLLGFRLRGLRDALEVKNVLEDETASTDVGRWDAQLYQLVANTPYVDCRIGADEFLRVTHYAVSGAKPDGDILVLTEIYPPGTLERLRVAIQYYPQMRSGRIDFGPISDLPMIVDRLAERLCGRYCKKADAESTSPYRFPDCIAFLRLYDVADTTRADSIDPYSLHVPFCHVTEFLANCGGDIKHSAVVTQAQNRSIPSGVFSQLFPRMMLGSCWLNDEDLTRIHRVFVTFVEGKVRSQISEVVHFQMSRKQSHVAATQLGLM